jgi:DNA-binding beta-propeller fold protein YncE
MKRITRIIYAAFAVVALAMGTLTANAAPGDLFASIDGGPGNGSIYRYSPTGVQTTFASSLSHPRGLAFDSAGNLFVATNFCQAVCQNTILKITPDGTQTVFATLAGFFAQGVAIDRSDNVFVMLTNPGFRFTIAVIDKFTPDGRPAEFGMLPGPSVEGFGLAFDSTGNLFAADAVQSTIYKFTPDRTRSIFVGPEAGIGPIGLAFDRFGNLLVSTEMFPFTNDTIFKFTPSAVKSTFATGLAGPRGLAFDSAGNLFVAEIPFSGPGDILKITPGGTRTVFASGFSGVPEYLAIQP